MQSDALMKEKSQEIAWKGWYKESLSISFKLKQDFSYLED